MNQSHDGEHESARSKRILIVEDDPILGAILLEALQDEAAYEASHVLSGEMAQHILQTDIPALVLLDYHLPGISGLELTDWLRSREERGHIPVLLMSADVLPPEASGKKHLKTLQKPFELEALLQSIAELLVSGANADPGAAKALSHNHGAQ
ncbi:response regulator [Ktedonospora formicarum]|uniref:Response regulator n=1 Tax=Ktedonospora formicarum TaxID=2778364 RepID=A0A8J3MVR2_9CHLR|nr:response regulator [Ktedonospora formicarum]GHO50607.1 response regulator [Ktedonospora formicarum]